VGTVLVTIHTAIFTESFSTESYYRAGVNAVVVVQGPCLPENLTNLIGRDFPSGQLICTYQESLEGVF